MNKTILGVALVAGTMCLMADVTAQTTQTEQLPHELKKAAGNEGHTVLKGNWSVSVGQEGKLCIYDNDNNVVRVLEGDVAAHREKGSIFNSPATYPFRLSVDKAGDLHIVDLSVYGKANSTAKLIHNPELMPGDPDLAPEAHKAMVMHKLPKAK